MKNKKGFIRIVEAIFAILIVMGAVLFVISKNVPTEDISEEVYEKQRSILEIVANNEAMREEIINEETTLTNSFIEKNIPNTWDFTTNICDIDEVCNDGTPNDRDVFVSESIISSTIDNYPTEGSRKLRFFVWRK